MLKKSILIVTIMFLAVFFLSRFQVLPHWIASFMMRSLMGIGFLIRGIDLYLHVDLEGKKMRDFALCMVCTMICFVWAVSETRKII